MAGIEVIVQHNNTKNGKTIALNLTDVVSSIKHYSYLEVRPGKLELQLKPLDSIEWLTEGALLTVKIDDHKLFFGYIFTYEVDQDKNCSIIAYDQMRYLQAKDTIVTANATASAIFKTVCERCGLKYKLVHQSKHILPQRISDNKAYADVIAHALDVTLITTNLWYFLRDNWGTLEFLDLYEQMTPVLIGDNSLLSSYSYKSSIDDETYNYIKLVRENKDTNRREVYIQKDSTTEKKWGTLQYYEEVEESMTTAQIKERAKMLLEYYNRPNKTLKLPTCIGDLRIKAGNSFVLLIDDLKTVVPYNKYVICSSCVHTFENGMHTMELEVII